MELALFSSLETPATWAIALPGTNAPTATVAIPPNIRLGITLIKCIFSQPSVEPGNRVRRASRADIRGAVQLPGRLWRERRGGSPGSEPPPCGLFGLLAAAVLVHFSGTAGTLVVRIWH